MKQKTMFSNQELNSTQYSPIQQQFLSKIIPIEFLLYYFQSTDHNNQVILSNSENDLKHFFQYIQDYHQQSQFQEKKILVLRKQQCIKDQQNENNLQILNVVIENMKNGSSTSIVLLDCLQNGIQLYDILNKFQLSQENLTQEQQENNRVAFINIISSDSISLLQSNFSNILQNFTIVIDSADNFNHQNLFNNKNCTNKSLALRNQYFLPFRFKDQEQKGKISSELCNLYKYFLKNKIIQFKPRIIILGIEIDEFFEINFYFLMKFIQQLKKISQNSLIIFPIRKQNLKQEKYWKNLVQCLNAIIYDDKERKKSIQKIKNVMKAEDYKLWADIVSQTKKEKEFYKKQFQSLNLIQKFEQQNQNNQNIKTQFKFPILNQQNNIEYVILEDQENQEQIVINSDIKYYVSYFKEDNQSKITISIIKNSQLYWGEGNINEIEMKNDENDKIIKLNKITYFKNNHNSSFLQDKYKFYQFNLDINSINQIIGTVYVHDFKAIQNNLIKFQVKNDHQILSHIKGFTAIKHSDTSFSLLSGCKDGNLYQQIGIKLDLFQENSLKLCQYKKQNSKLPKGYDYPLIAQLERDNDLKNQSTRFIYFESQTRYFAIPYLSEMYEINFSLGQLESTCRCDKFQNVSNIHLIQNYSRLFRSDQRNIKSEIINQNVFVLELVVFEQTLQRNQLQDLNDSKDLMLQKNLKWNYMHFKFIFQQQQSQQMKLKIDLNIHSMLFQTLNDNLNQICLSDNWIEEQNNQYIFLSNSKQHIYQLYYKKDKSGLYLKKCFEFQCLENIQDGLPFDEVIINDYYNCLIWIVRKYNNRSYPYLVIYNCHWMSLQNVKEEDNNRCKKVYMDKVYELNKFAETFDLIGFEIENINNMLIICTSKFICQVSIQILRNKNFSSFRQQLKNSISSDEIFYNNLNLSLKTAVIIQSLNENRIAFFYQYCIADCLDENQFLYKIKIQGKIWNKTENNQQNSNEYLNDENQTLIQQQFNYQASNTIIFARLTSLQLKNQFLQSLIFLEEECQQFYAVQLQFSLESNETVILRIIKQEFEKSKILTSISTNKAETLFFRENQTQIIKSVCPLDILTKIENNKN